MSTTTNVRISAFTKVGALQLYVTDCAYCGVPFAISHDYDERRRDDGRGFYCPNGHVMSYDSRDRKRMEQLEREATAAKNGARWAREDAERQRQKARRADYQARAAKGELTKAKKRAAAGLCPCCRRTFQNVQRHVQSQHPDFTRDATT